MSGKEFLKLMTHLAAPSEVRRLLAKHGLHCRKSLGQNFLVDANIVSKIISAARPGKQDTLVEIGPGLGVLTREAARRAGSVVALELDQSLRPVLEDTLGDLDNVQVVFGDAMEADLDGTVLQCTGRRGPYKLVSNLPYYITTPLILRLLKSGFNISLLVVMVQQEVAERIAALPGGKDYGALSVAVQYYTEASYLFRVPATVFIPRPEVDSAVIRLVRRDRPAVEVPDQELFFKIVRGSFGQRRKTLINALGSAFGGIPRETLKEMLLEAGVDPGRRGETLGLEEFAGIARRMYNYKVQVVQRS